MEICTCCGKPAEIVYIDDFNKACEPCFEYEKNHPKYKETA